MCALSPADRSTGSAQSVEEVSGMRATGVGARSRCAGWLSLSRAFAGKRQ